MRAIAERLIGSTFPRLLDFYHLRRIFKSQLGHFPNVLFPKTFSEKIESRKLFDRDPRLPRRADKILIKDFVRQKLGPEWTTPTIWHGKSLPPENERNWSIPFVLKANHGSAMNVFVRSQDELEWPKIEQFCRKWLSEIYGEWAAEWLYSQIDPMLPG